jgi:hypothetical protein
LNCGWPLGQIIADLTKKPMVLPQEGPSAGFKKRR